MRLVILAAGGGRRLLAESNGHSKSLLDVAGRTILDRAIELAGQLGLSPLVVTRREHAAELGRRAEVRIEEEPTDLITTLYSARDALSETFCWMGGDMIFTDPQPLCELLAAHLSDGLAASMVYCRTDRFKAKLRLGPPLAVEVTRAGRHELSMPTFMVQSPRLFADIALAPRDGFLQRAIDRGEPMVAREYRAPVFEIDTPADLAEARRFFATFATVATPTEPPRLLVP
jgi:NDP-sugar pyrophosphorylase family protein